MFAITLSLHLLRHNETCWRVAPRQHVNEGCRRERQCSNEGSSDEVAEYRSGRQRRILRQARRKPCMLNGHSSTKVGLEPGSIGKETDDQAVRAGPGMASWWRVRAAPPWIRQRLWWEQVRPDRPSPALPAAYGDGGVSRS